MNDTIDHQSLLNWTTVDANDTSTPVEWEETLSLEEYYRLYLPGIRAMNRYLTFVWYAIGFPGNLLSLAVWIQPRLRHSSGCYLAALAAADFLFLVLYLVLSLQSYWDVPVFRQHGICEGFPVVFYATQYLSPLLVLAFSVERYISICHPFHRERFCTTRRAVIVIASLSCAVVLINVVQAYFWKYDDDKRECGFRGEVPEHVLTRWSWATELLVFLCVPVAIGVFNVCVVIETYRIKVKQHKLFNAPRRPSVFEHSTSATAVTLLVVSFYYVATTLPVTVGYMLNFTFPPGNMSQTSPEEIRTDATWQAHLRYVAVRDVIYQICMSHYAANFLIYLATGACFRAELRRLLLRWFPCVAALIGTGSSCGDITMSTYCDGGEGMVMRPSMAGSVGGYRSSNVGRPSVGTTAGNGFGGGRKSVVIAAGNCQDAIDKRRVGVVGRNGNGSSYGNNSGGSSHKSSMTML